VVKSQPLTFTAKSSIG